MSVYKSNDASWEMIQTIEKENSELKENIYRQEQKLYKMGTYYKNRVFFSRAMWISFSFFCLFLIFIFSGTIFNRDAYFYVELAMICIYVVAPMALASLIAFFVFFSKFNKYTVEFEKISDGKTTNVQKNAQFFISRIENEELKLCDMKKEINVREKELKDLKVKVNGAS